MISRPLAILSLLFSLLMTSLVEAATVEGVRVWRAPDHTRIVLDLSGPVNHVVAPLTNPERLVLDISGVKLKADLSQLPLSNTPVAQIRTSVHNGTDLRMVFDLKAKVDPRSFSLKPHAGNSDRLVLDFYDLPSGGAAPVVSATP